MKKPLAGGDRPGYLQSVCIIRGGGLIQRDTREPVGEFPNEGRPLPDHYALEAWILETVPWDLPRVLQRPGSGMKKLLLITFDFTRPDEPATSLAVGSLMSRLRMDPRYGSEFVAEHVSFNLYNREELTTDHILANISRKNHLTDVHAIAIGCYVWASRLINPLLSALRANGYQGRIILGGYDIASREEIATEYPLANVFILGYAEESLVQAIDIPLGRDTVILDREPNFQILPSPYLTGDIAVEQGQGRVRLETKRGCLRKCAYCAHKDLQRNKLYSHELSRVYAELSYLHKLQVRKLNIVDPSFNQGSTYRDVLRRCATIGFQANIALQVCFEDITGREGDEFVDLCSSLNITLEFGLQTIVEPEMRLINRVNNIPHVQRVMEVLRHRGIPYEVSLIYGLPGQSFESFRESMAFLIDKGCAVIRSFPLKLLKGTTLWGTRHTWGAVETPEGPFDIPVVTASNSFTRDEWERMRSLSKTVRRVTERDYRGRSPIMDGPNRQPRIAWHFSSGSS